jgi:hypothetical protein
LNLRTDRWVSMAWPIGIVRRSGSMLGPPR